MTIMCSCCATTCGLSLRCSGCITYSACCFERWLYLEIVCMTKTTTRARPVPWCIPHKLLAGPSICTLLVVLVHHLVDRVLFCIWNNLGDSAMHFQLRLAANSNRSPMSMPCLLSAVCTSDCLHGIVVSSYRIFLTSGQGITLLVRCVIGI